ncbi:hypothetical protein CC78DRAFT_584372 [Lojkania enalia]|uniref:Uncharacterized protein n=1 Tax=Lojkania enalia TaxID=147567 RepID=A0A9P4MX18_9PLEO|nr:hypothetical protein CC78DRAFT_584372 [Didymosphaeria enalia]
MLVSVSTLASVLPPRSDIDKAAKKTPETDTAMARSPATGHISGLILVANYNTTYQVEVMHPSKLFAVSLGIALTAAGGSSGTHPFCGSASFKDPIPPNMITYDLLQNNQLNGGGAFCQELRASAIRFQVRGCHCEFHYGTDCSEGLANEMFAEEGKTINAPAKEGVKSSKCSGKGTV